MGCATTSKSAKGMAWDDPFERKIRGAIPNPGAASSAWPGWRPIGQAWYHSGCITSSECSLRP